MTTSKPHSGRELPSGGTAISDKLWKFECGCIEGWSPYRFYSCSRHKQPGFWTRLARRLTG